MANILAIDDEEDILMLIKNILVKDRHLVTTMSSVKDVEIEKFNGYDLILLDVMMPDIDGFTLCEKIRGSVDCPIIFLTAKIMENDIMYGLGLGADDYITKPFGVGELRARVNAHLRRENREKKSYLVVSGIKFNLASKEIYVEDEKLNLTKSEYSICEYLAKNKGQVFSKDRICDIVYGFEGEGSSAGIAEHIKNIRSKFNEFSLTPIETVWGVGYKWV